jgi:hypothetical protein
MAAHYAPMGIHAWEIWNEPNGGNFWGPAPDPAAYTALLKAAYTAIHQADPNAIVITAGLSQPGDSATSIDAREFLTAMYAAGAHGFLDAVGDHPYGSDNWQKMFSTSPSFLSIMAANGDSDKKIWVTEDGTPTGGNNESPVTEQQQADLITQLYTDASGFSWIGPVFWYNYQDFCAAGSSDSECYYGLLRSDGSQKPSFGSYQNAPN